MEKKAKKKTLNVALHISDYPRQNVSPFDKIGFHFREYANLLKP